MGLLKRRSESVQTGGISNLYLSRECLKDASFWMWRYCLYEHLSSSAVQMGSAVTCLQPCSVLPAWISLPADSLSWEVRGHPPRMYTWALSSHLFNVQTRATQRCTVSRMASRLQGRCGLAIPCVVSCREPLPAS